LSKSCNTIATLITERGSYGYKEAVGEAAEKNN